MHSLGACRSISKSGRRVGCSWRCRFMGMWSLCPAPGLGSCAWIVMTPVPLVRWSSSMSIHRKVTYPLAWLCSSIGMRLWPLRPGRRPPWTPISQTPCRFRKNLSGTRWIALIGCWERRTLSTVAGIRIMWCAEFILSTRGGPGGCWRRNCCRSWIGWLGTGRWCRLLFWAVAVRLLMMGFWYLSYFMHEYYKVSDRIKSAWLYNK